MTAFFRNNFSEDRWRKAALKNAFSLLGKQRFQHSAAFFLLAGSLKDAVEASEKYRTCIKHWSTPVILLLAVKPCYLLFTCIYMLIIFIVQIVPVEAATVTDETTFVVMLFRTLRLWIIDQVDDSWVFLSRHQMVTFFNQPH